LISALNNEMRKQESAVLAGLGYTRFRITGLRLLESVPVLLAGGFTGAIAGLAYTHLLFAGLNSIWQNAIRTDMLTVHILPVTILLSIIIGMVISFLSICWTTWHKLKNPLSILLKNYQNDSLAASYINYRSKQKIGIALITLSFILVVYSVISSAYQHAGLFLTAGGLFLAGNILL